MGNTNKNVVIDLFCGAGGLTNGLLQAGLNVVAGFDTDHYAKFVYEHNNKPSVFINTDVRDVSSSELEDLFGDAEFRVLVGCAPCQPFSAMVPKRTGNINPKRDLLLEIGRLVSETLPDVILLENVSRIRTIGKDIFDKFLTILGENNYHVHLKNLNFVKYGVPQNRNRLILLASRLGPIETPEPLFTAKDQYVSILDTIGHLPEIRIAEPNLEDRFHTTRSMTSLSKKRLKHISEGEDWRVLPDELMRKSWLAFKRNSDAKKKKSVFFDINGRQHRTKPSSTLTCDCGQVTEAFQIHYEQDRAFSLREVALLQTFPSDYVFWPANKKLKKSIISRFIGNAVPPLMGKILGNTILNHLEENGDKNG